MTAPTLDPPATDESDGSAAGATTPRRADPAAWGARPLVRIPVLAIGGIVTLAVLAVGTFAVVNVLVRTTETDTATLPGEVLRAEIHVTGSVTVRPGPTDQARVDRRSSFGVSRPLVTTTLVDGLLTVRVECRGVATVTCRNQVTVEIPAGASVSVDALGSTIQGVRGSVEITSGAGSIHLVDLSGPVAVDVGAGSVRGVGLDSEQVRASAGAGSIDLAFVAPPRDVVATSGTGSVAVAVPPGPEAYRVDASAGAGSTSVEVATDPTSDRVIRADAGTGSATVRYVP